MRRALALLLLPALAACAAKPHLYPNQRHTEEESKAAVAECQQQASAFIKSGAGKRIGGDVVEGGVTGAAAGAVTGAVFGDLGRGAAAGGLTGATIGLVRGLFRARQPSPVRRAYVDRCLRDRGYDVLGWE